jgi:histidinol-phosphate aminotransferase
MTEIDQLLRPDLRGQSAYGAPQLDVPVRLNTNENPHPPSAQLAAAIGAAASTVALELNRYPDRDAVGLRTDLAQYLSARTGVQLTTQNVWAANGSNEILQQTLQAFGGPGRTALGFEPSYSMHRLIALGTSTAWVAAQRAADFTLTADAVSRAIHDADPDVVFLCSPNNPTGTALDLDVVEAAYDASRGVVVVDEAYAEFSRRPSAVGLLAGRPRLVVTRTMSKAFAFAGARVGYLAADPAVVAALQLVRLPYHLSALTQAAARAALAASAELLGSVEAVKVERDRIVGDLRAAGYCVVDSDANFVLFGHLTDARATWQQLLDRGVLVRDVGLPGWLRVTAGTSAETSTFLAVMADLAATVPDTTVPDTTVLDTTVLDTTKEPPR